MTLDLSGLLAQVTAQQGADASIETLLTGFSSALKDALAAAPDLVAAQAQVDQMTATLTANVAQVNAAVAANPLPTVSTTAAPTTTSAPVATTQVPALPPTTPAPAAPAGS